MACARRPGARARKRKIFWAYETDTDTWQALEELHRSDEMISRYDNPGQSDAQRVLLAEERKRRDRARRTVEQLLARDVVKGRVIFDGTVEDSPTGELKPAAVQVITGLVEKIYPQLKVFEGSFKKADVLQILQADTLDGMPDSVGPDGLGLYRITASGRELVADSGSINTVVSWIRDRKSFGEDQNGLQLERHFGDPPYGATVEALQATLAGAMRAGRIQVISQASKITSATDRRLEQVFGNLPKFRTASFQPAQDTGPSVEVRGEVSEWLSAVIGEPLSLDLHELAQAGRRAFESLRQPGVEARGRLEGAGLAVPDVLGTMQELLGRVLSGDDELVVSTLHERRADLDAGRTEVPAIAAVVDEHVDVLKAAQRSVRASRDLADEHRDEWAGQLGELLERARYGEDLAQIKALTTKIEEAAKTETEAVQTDVVSNVEAALATLRSRYPSIADDAFADAVAPLRGLASATDLPTLRANVKAVMGVSHSAADTLDALATTKEVRHVSVAEVWGGPITSVEEVDTALARIREAVLTELAPDTEVRFR